MQIYQFYSLNKFVYNLIIVGKTLQRFFIILISSTFYNNERHYTSSSMHAI